jgi:hypothetical protein
MPWTDDDDAGRTWGGGNGDASAKALNALREGVSTIVAHRTASTLEQANQLRLLENAARQLANEARTAWLQVTAELVRNGEVTIAHASEWIPSPNGGHIDQRKLAHLLAEVWPPNPRRGSTTPMVTRVRRKEQATS